MSPLENLDMEIKGIGQILTEKKPAVPKNQRTFAWEERHVTDFLEDIETAMAAGLDKTYFLGTIVSISHLPNRPEVVDGQQRLALTGILLAAIRDYFVNNGKEEDAKSIEELLIRRERRSGELVPNIKLNLQDNDYYCKKILSAPNQRESSLQPVKESHKRLDNAALLAKRQVEKIATMSTPRERLMDWVDYVEKNVRVVWVEVADATDAYTIFETLNDRGVDLAVSDLMKNYLFKLAGDRLDEVQNQWVEMAAIIESAADEETIVTYIRHYWSSVNGYTREKELFKAIKDGINTKQSAIDFAADLTRTAKLYASMINTDHENWSAYKTATRTCMVNLNMFGMIQIRPLILSILKNFAPNEVDKGIKLLESWAVRFLIVGGLGGGTLEKHYSGCAKRINEGEIKRATEIIEGMGAVVPKDKVFKEGFCNATVSKAKLARYYLRMLEQQTLLEHGRRLESIPNIDEKIVTLEHILPQSPSDVWSHINADDVDALYNRIGNMTILDSKLNLEAGNDSFDEKKMFYKESDFMLTSTLFGYKHWGMKEIEKRQEELAELAVKLWPYNI